MKKVLYTAFAIITLMYLGACAYLYASQREMIYFPPAGDPVPDAEALYLQNEGETIRVWKVAGSGPDALIYFGGNAEHVAHNAPRLSAAFGEYSIYLADYRGFGGSTGSPTEAGLFSDALALHDYLSDRHPNISVIGRSLGSGVAVYLASQRDIAKMVLVTPYDSVARVAQQAYPVFPVELLLQDKFDSVGRIAAVQEQTLIVVVENDEIIPRSNSDALIAAFDPQQVEVTVIPNSSHARVDQAPEYLPILGGFL